MKTDSQTPDHEELKALLAKSFHSEEADNVPPLPDALRDRIQDQYGKAKAKSPARTASEEHSESIFAKISRLFAQPAFGGAAAALVLIAVAAFFLIPKDDPTIPDGPRGATAYNGVTIVLYGFDADQAEAIKKQLDPESAKILTNLSGEPSGEGRTIIIDGKDGEIEGYTSHDAEAIIVALPDSPAQIADAIAKMLLELRAATKADPTGQ
jgi:hypothetical protein